MPDEESFYVMLESLKEQWSNFDEKGRQSYKWFCQQKSLSFLHPASWLRSVKERVLDFRLKGLRQIARNKPTGLSKNLSERMQ